MSGRDHSDGDGPASRSEKRRSRNMAEMGVVSTVPDRDGRSGTVLETAMAPTKHSAASVNSEVRSEIPSAIVAIGRITTCPPAAPAVSSPKIIPPLPSISSPATYDKAERDESRSQTR